jgi:hypothetical protein
MACSISGTYLIALLLLLLLTQKINKPHQPTNTTNSQPWIHQPTEQIPSRYDPHDSSPAYVTHQ